MADVIVSKIKFRRGLDWQRQILVFDQGEPIYTTDTKRLYVGSGTLSGGIVVGSKIHNPIINYSSLVGTIAEVGDIVNANSKFYQLTAKDYTNFNSWADVSLKIDESLFKYTPTNRLTLRIDAFQGDSTLSGYNIENSLSAIFNGSPLNAYAGSGNISKFTALSSDGTSIVNLSSAGFITFEGNTTTIHGDTIQRFAIPIFKY